MEESYNCARSASTATDKRQGAGFAKHAEALADFTLARIVVRLDVYGAYTPDGGQYTAHAPLTRELLIRHCRGELTIGAHSTSPDGRCLCVAADIDAHDDTADPGLNWRIVLALVAMLKALGLTAIVCDSNGAGGYHVRAFFKKPVAVAVAWWLCIRMNAVLAADGLPAVETFPKQGELSLDRPYGNWLRLPGRHHKRPHWTRIYDDKGDGWLEGEAAARRLIAVKGDNTRGLLNAYRADQGPVSPEGGSRPKKSGARRPASDDVARAAAALACIPNDDIPYDRWLAIGMALSELGEDGRRLFHEFSMRSAKYDPGTTDAKYDSLTPGAGITLGTLFHEAKQHGWTAAERNGRHPSNEGCVSSVSPLNNTPPPPRGAKAKAEPSTNGDDHDGLGSLMTTRLSKIKPVPIRWQVPRYIPRGKLVVIAGDGGLGKSTFTIDASARTSVGHPWFGLEYEAPPPADVLLISCEDDFADTVVPRLIAAGADLARIEKVDGITRADGKAAPFGLAHYEALEAHLQANDRIGLVVIDPAGAYVGRTGVDDHRNSELTALLAPLAELAGRRNVTIILVCHVNKGLNTKAVHRIMGGVGYVNSARAVFVLGPDPDDEDRRLIVRAKGNCGPQPPGRAFRMAPIAPEQKDAIWQTTLLDHLAVEDKALLLGQMMAVRWEKGSVDTSADDVLGRGGRRSKGPTKIEQAGDWLVKLLGEGPRISEDIFAEGQKAGFTKDNLYKAKQAREIKAKPTGYQGDFRWGLGDPDRWPPATAPIPFEAETPY